MRKKYSHTFNVQGFTVVWGREKIKLFRPLANGETSLVGEFKNWYGVAKLIETQTGHKVKFEVTARLIPAGRDKVRTFQVQCPFCGEIHTHGAGLVGEDILSYLGNRGSHCQWGSNGEYDIVGYFEEVGK